VVLAQEGTRATSWAPGYLVTILVLLFVRMVTLAPSRRADKPKQFEFTGTSRGQGGDRRDGEEAGAPRASPGGFCSGTIGTKAEI